MFSFALINPLPLLLSFSALTGIMLHDTLADRATNSVLGLPLLSSNTSNESHTQIERDSFSQTIQALNSNTLQMQPRTDDRKHLSTNQLHHGQKMANTHIPRA